MRFQSSRKVNGQNAEQSTVKFVKEGGSNIQHTLHWVSNETPDQLIKGME